MPAPFPPLWHKWRIPVFSCLSKESPRAPLAATIAWKNLRCTTSIYISSHTRKWCPKKYAYAMTIIQRGTKCSTCKLLRMRIRSKVVRVHSVITKTSSRSISPPHVTLEQQRCVCVCHKVLTLRRPSEETNQRTINAILHQERQLREVTASGSNLNSIRAECKNL